MAWNARAWVASVLGCDVDDLEILDRSPGQVRYQDRGGKQVAWLVVADPLNTPRGMPKNRYEIMLRLSDGTFHRPDEVVLSSTEIEF